MRKPRMPRLALLAGGLATRMRPATLAIAKSMLPVAGVPFLGHQLQRLAGEGVREIVICCGHLEEQLREYAGDGSAWGCAVEYSPDGADPLGTGGAVRRALPLLGREFMVMYGDSFLPTAFPPVWAAFQDSQSPAMMTVYRNAGLWDASNVEFRDGQLVRYSKHTRTPEMHHIDYGLSCFRAEAFDGWPEGVRFDLAEVMTSLQEHGALAGFEVQERFYEIGSYPGLAELDVLLRSPATPGDRA